jgi:organic radical activating enzyme
MTNVLRANVVDNFPITFLDYPDPENYAVEIYFCGCDFSCPTCSNPELRNANYSRGTRRYNVDELVLKIKDVCKRNSTKHIVAIGGDSCSRDNREFTKEFVKRMCKDYNICIYTGYNADDFGWFGIEGFKFVKCGTFKKELQPLSEKTDEYMQFASKNQILYNQNLEQISENGKYYFNEELIEKHV